MLTKAKHFMQRKRRPRTWIRRSRQTHILSIELLVSSIIVAVLAPPSTPVIAQNSGRERDAWQHPQEVMDQLGVHAGSAVADVGCGAGYFTFLLAARVGPAGKVYAEDVDAERVDQVRRRARQERITNVQTVSGTADDPRLPPASIDAVLIVDAYHEMRQYDRMLTAIFRALKPGGLLALIDGIAEPGRPRSDYYARHRMPAQIERQDAERNGFRFVRQPDGFTRPSDGKQYYFLIFEKPR